MSIIGSDYSPEELGAIAWLGQPETDRLEREIVAAYLEARHLERTRSQERVDRICRWLDRGSYVLLAVVVVAFAAIIARNV